MTQHAEWLERMQGVAVPEVAGALGIAQTRGGQSGLSFGPCPVCGAERRHTKTKDKRGALGVNRNNPHGWRCFQCDAGGDSIDLVAYRVCGNRFRDLHDAGKAEVREWCQRFVGVDSTAPIPPRAATKPPPDKPPEYPPAEETGALWAACAPVTTDPDIAAWLTDTRKIDAELVAAADLARVVPADLEVPGWAGFQSEGKPRRAWPSCGLRLIVPLHDAGGRMRSFLFRRPFETSDQWPPKSVGATGYARAGLVMANGVARYLLEYDPANTDGVRVVISEGETDWLLANVTWDNPPGQYACFGLFEGGWNKAMGARIPKGAEVIIRTDNDGPGDKYAASIIKTLDVSCKVKRGGTK